MNEGCPTLYIGEAKQEDHMTCTMKIYIPDKEKFKAYLYGIYESGCLTNNGPLVQRLEKKLEEYLGVKNLLCIFNGTDTFRSRTFCE